MLVINDEDYSEQVTLAEAGVMVVRGKYLLFHSDIILI